MSKPSRDFDFDTAADYAVSCVRSSTALQVNISSCWNHFVEHPPFVGEGFERGDEKLHEFQAKAAAMVGKLAGLYVRANAVMSRELLAALIDANAAEHNLPTAKIGNHRYTTHHEAALATVEGLLLVPELAGIQFCLPFDQVVRPDDAEWDENSADRLEKALSAVVGDGARDYWNAVRDGVHKFPTGEPEEMLGRIEQEVAFAKAASQSSGGAFTHIRPAEAAGIWPVSAETWVREGKVKAAPMASGRSGFKSATDLATEHGLPCEALRHRLQRWRKQNGQGWMEVSSSERGPRDAQFLYRPDAVAEVVNSMRRE